MQRPQQCPLAGGLVGEIDGVPRLDDVGAGRDDELLATGDGPDHDAVVLHDLPETGQRLLNERAALHAHPDHTDEPVGELAVLHGSGKREKALDGADDLLLRVDEHTDLQGPAAEQLGIGGVLFRAYPCQFHGFRGDGVGEQAGDDIGFVAVGHGQKNSGVARPRIFENRWDGAGPEHGLHVHVVFYPAELVRVLVNNHNLLLLFGQALRNVEPHFPRSHDDDLEFFNFLGSTTKQHKASNNAYRMDFALKQQFIARIQTTAV